MLPGFKTHFRPKKKETGLYDYILLHVYLILNSDLRTETSIGKLAFSKIHISTILVTERFSWIPQIIDNQECGKYFPPFQTLLCVGCTVANLAYRR